MGVEPGAADCARSTCAASGDGRRSVDRTTSCTRVRRQPSRRRDDGDALDVDEPGSRAAALDDWWGACSRRRGGDALVLGRPDPRHPPRRGAAALEPRQPARRMHRSTRRTTSRTRGRCCTTATRRSWPDGADERFLAGDTDIFTTTRRTSCIRRSASGSSRSAWRRSAPTNAFGWRIDDRARRHRWPCSCSMLIATPADRARRSLAVIAGLLIAVDGHAIVDVARRAARQLGSCSSRCSGSGSCCSTGTHSTSRARSARRRRAGGRTRPALGAGAVVAPVDHRRRRRVRRRVRGEVVGPLVPRRVRRLPRRRRRARAPPRRRAVLADAAPS